MLTWGCSPSSTTEGTTQPGETAASTSQASSAEPARSTTISLDAPPPPLPTEKNLIPACELVTPAAAQQVGVAIGDFEEVDNMGDPLRQCRYLPLGFGVTTQTDPQCESYFKPGIGSDIKFDYVQSLPPGIELAVISGNDATSRMLHFCINWRDGNGYTVRVSGPGVTTATAAQLLAEFGPRTIELYQQYYK